MRGRCPKYRYFSGVRGTGSISGAALQCVHVVTSSANRRRERGRGRALILGHDLQGPQLLNPFRYPIFFKRQIRQLRRTHRVTGLKIRNPDGVEVRSNAESSVSFFSE